MWGSCFDSVSRLLRRRPSVTHTTLSHTICHTHNFVTHTIFHTQIYHTPSLQTTLSHTIFHTQLCQTQLCHTIFRTQLCHTHTHTIFHTQLCQTQLCHTPSVTHTTLSHTHNFVTHHLSHNFVVAGVALAAMGWLWWRALARLVAGDAGILCVAGVALGDIDLHFARQAWHLATSTFTLRGRRGTWQDPPSLCVAGVALIDIYLRFAWHTWQAGSGGALGRAWSPVTPRYFAWQA